MLVAWLQIVERGTHDQLLEQHGIYAKLVSRQQYVKDRDALQPDTPPSRPSGGSRSNNGTTNNGNGNGNGNGSNGNGVMSRISEWSNPTFMCMA